MLIDSKTSQVGVYNFTPIEVFTINQKFPLGIKLELEERYLNKMKNFQFEGSNKCWSKRLRKSTIKKKKRKKEIKRLIYSGKPNINPQRLTKMKCNLVLKKIYENPNSVTYKDNINLQSAPSLNGIQKNILNGKYDSFYDFKSALRWLWLYYYLNFDRNREIMQITSIMSKFTEECFEEVESLSEEQILNSCRLQRNISNSTSYQNGISEQFNYYYQNSPNYISGYPINKSEVLKNNINLNQEEHQVKQCNPQQINQHNNNSNNIKPSLTYKNNNLSFLNAKRAIGKQNNTINQQVNSSNIYKFQIGNNNTQRSLNVPMNSLYQNNSNNQILRPQNTGNVFDSLARITPENQLNKASNFSCDLGSKFPLTQEEKSNMKRIIETLTKSQFMGIVPVLQDYFVQNNDPNSKCFTFDLDKLNIHQIQKLKNYLNECLQENEKKQQITNISKGKSNTNLKQNTNFGIGFNPVKIQQYIGNSYINMQNFQSNEIDNVNMNQLKQDSNTQRGLLQYQNNTIVLDKQQNSNFRLGYSFDGNQIGSAGFNSNFYYPINANLNNKNENIGTETRNNDIAIGNNSLLMSNWNANYQTTNTVNNYTNLRQINNQLNNNANNSNIEYNSDSGFDFH